jgi:hypothetical protein
MLGEPSRVLECRGRGLDALDRDIVPQRVQKGLHVPFDARIEQLDDSRIAAQLGDLVLEGVANERRDLGEPFMNALSGRRDQAAYVRVVVATPFGHPMTVDPGPHDGQRFAAASQLCRRDNRRCHLYPCVTMPPDRGIPTVINHNAIAEEEHKP